MSSGAFAQTGTSAPSSSVSNYVVHQSGGGLDDTVVTARREERLHEVPLTVAAVSSQTLAASGRQRFDVQIRDDMPKEFDLIQNGSRALPKAIA